MNRNHMCRLLGLLIALSCLSASATAQNPKRRPAVRPDTQRVVFVCEHGSVKSMIAATLFNRLALERGLAARAVSRGTAPDRAVPDLVRSGLLADGEDIGNRLPVRLGLADAPGADLFVAFDVEVPPRVSNRVPVRRWDGTPSVMRNYAEGRSAIAANVAQLIDELARAPRADRRRAKQPPSP